MNEAALERLFGWRHAFDHPATVWIVAGIVTTLLVAAATIGALGRLGRLSPGLQHELWLRLRSWCVLAPLLVAPVLAGAFWTIVAVTGLSLWCVREFSRATGLFRERLVCVLVVLGVVALGGAALDHWYDLFTALIPLGAVAITGIAVIADEPRGYIQRSALGVYAFLFFGACLGHLGYIANDAGYRPVLLFVLVAVEGNDVFAYVSGRLFGRRRLAPRTSPNKTWAGAIGALLLTSALTLGLGPFVFAGQPVDQVGHLLLLGALISIAGQLGDLMLSSIKRDLGIKDFATTIPGHGGVLDRFDSLVLVAPAVFHFVGHLQGFGLDGARRILTGG